MPRKQPPWAEIATLPPAERSGEQISVSPMIVDGPDGGGVIRQSFKRPEPKKKNRCKPCKDFYGYLGARFSYVPGLAHQKNKKFTTGFWKHFSVLLSVLFVAYLISDMMAMNKIMDT